MSEKTSIDQPPLPTIDQDKQRRDLLSARIANTTDIATWNLLRAAGVKDEETINSFKGLFVRQVQAVYLGGNEEVPVENMEERMDIIQTANVTIPSDSQLGLGVGYDVRRDYGLALQQIRQAFIRDGKFEKEAFAAWAMIKAAELMGGEGSKQKEFRRVVFLAEQSGLVGQDTVGIVGKSTDAFLRILHIASRSLDTIEKTEEIQRIIAPMGELAQKYRWDIADAQDSCAVVGWNKENVVYWAREYRNQNGGEKWALEK